MRIVLAGGGRLGASLLRPLLDSSHEVVAVVQDGRKTRGGKRRWWPWVARFLGGRYSMPGWAKRLGLPILWLDKMDEGELAPLAALAPDLLLVGGFGIILKKAVLELPRIGCVNAHSSLLPRHRGPNPFAAVVMAGDTHSGVSFHRIDEGIDTGDILDQTAFEVGARDTLFTVYARACTLAGERVVAVMDRIAQEGLEGRPQDPDMATYEKKPLIEDARILWDQPAIRIDRMVRALAPSPMPWFVFRGRRIRVSHTEFDPSPVEAAPGTVLRNRPGVTVATQEGSISLTVALTSSPLPWLWPNPLSRPRVGEWLE